MGATEFIENIAYYVQRYAPQYDIRVHSPIIAQAIIESAFGKSTLAARYHNYFGLTCGTGWTGPSVNMRTKEEYTPGVLTDISQNWRVYPDMESGVKGYFDFIQYPRYKNLKGVTDPKEYLQLIKQDGYATASNYVAANMAIVDQYHLRRYDSQQAAAPTEAKESKESADGYTFHVDPVRMGSTGKSAALMQKCLRALGYRGANGKRITVDAAAGMNSIYALERFQEAAGLQASGVCDAESWKILLDL